MNLRITENKLNEISYKIKLFFLSPKNLNQFIVGSINRGYNIII